MTETPVEYTNRLLGYIQGSDPMEVLKRSPSLIATLLAPYEGEKLRINPAPGKWSVAEILAHLVEGEIVFGYRLRQIASSNGIAIQGFDQNAWQRGASYLYGDPTKAAFYFSVLRELNVAFIQGLPKEMMSQYGMHAERGMETIGHLISLYAGHDVNHIRRIEALLRL